MASEEAGMKAVDLPRIDRAASVQFKAPITVRLIRVLDWITYDGWAWIDCYQLNNKGDAIARRELYLMPERVQVLSRPSPRPAAAKR
ncbi:hypothetical protein [Micromonospora ureilytica]|uniref:hypothetical protein n=1 Tax=Micromonospora ureilytica TaxID=709868 RepID=UPI0039903C8B